MPYMNMQDEETFVHLVQLFLAAHPHYQQLHQGVRVQAGAPGGYFLSLDMMRDLATWARQRHLVTRNDATRLVEVAQQLHTTAHPERTITLTPRRLGIPPQLQPTVLASKMHAWLYLVDPATQATDEDVVFTVPAAVAFLEHLAQDTHELAAIRARAQRLRDWLRAQQEH